MNHALSFLLLGAALAASAGCLKTADPRPQTVGLQSTQLNLNSVNVIDRNILQVRKTLTGQQYDYGKILVESSGASRTATGTLAVFTTLENLTDHPQALQVRTRFYDEGRAPIEDFSAWQRLDLPPRSIGTYRESSLSNRAAFFYVEVKEGQ